MEMSPVKKIKPILPDLSCLDLITLIYREVRESYKIPLHKISVERGQDAFQITFKFENSTSIFHTVVDYTSCINDFFKVISKFYYEKVIANFDDI